MGEDFKKFLSFFRFRTFYRFSTLRSRSPPRRACWVIWSNTEHAASQSDIASTAATGELASTAADGLSDDADPRELEVDCWQHCDGNVYGKPGTPDGTQMMTSAVPPEGRLGTHVVRVLPQSALAAATAAAAAGRCACGRLLAWLCVCTFR